jgi:hypothetical protein
MLNVIHHVDCLRTELIVIELSGTMLNVFLLKVVSPLILLILPMGLIRYFHSINGKRLRQLMNATN